MTNSVELWVSGVVRVSLIGRTRTTLHVLLVVKKAIKVQIVLKKK